MFKAKLSSKTISMKVSQKSYIFFKKRGKRLSLVMKLSVYFSRVLSCMSWSIKVFLFTLPFSISKNSFRTGWWAHFFSVESIILGWVFWVKQCKNIPSLIMLSAEVKCLINCSWFVMRFQLELETKVHEDLCLRVPTSMFTFKTLCLFYVDIDVKMGCWCKDNSFFILCDCEIFANLRFELWWWGFNSSPWLDVICARGRGEDALSGDPSLHLAATRDTGQKDIYLKRLMFPWKPTGVSDTSFCNQRSFCQFSYKLSCQLNYKWKTLLYLLSSNLFQLYINVNMLYLFSVSLFRFISCNRLQFKTAKTEQKSLSLQENKTWKIKIIKH